MIKFFRKIRQKMLAENKFSKYLLYAIGEIVLVVIGILVAVSINNWNQEINDKKSERQYLVNLLADIRLQISEYELSAQSEIDAANNVKRIGTMLESGIELEDMDSLNKLLSTLMMERAVNIFNATFDDLKSTGNVQLFSNKELKSQLMEFYQSVERADRVILKNQGFKLNTREELLKNVLVNVDLLFSPQMKDFLSQSGLEVKNPMTNGLDNYNKIVMENILTKEGLLKMKNLLNTRYLSSMVTLTQINKMKALAIKMEAILQQEIQQM